MGRTALRWFLALGLLGSLTAHAASPVWAIRGPHNTVYLAGSVHLLPAHDAALQDTLGWIFYRKGIYSRAIEHLKKAVGKDPTARQELMELGLTSLPVILIGDKRLTGFNPTAIDAALAAE